MDKKDDSDQEEPQQQSNKDYEQGMEMVPESDEAPVSSDTGEPSDGNKELFVPLSKSVLEKLPKEIKDRFPPELMEMLSSEQRGDNEGPVLVLQSSERSAKMEIRHYTRISHGPLPPPKVLTEYNKAYPDAAKDIVSMAKEAMAHYHRMQEKAAGLEGQDLENVHDATRRGQRSALIVALAWWWSPIFGQPSISRAN